MSAATYERARSQNAVSTCAEDARPTDKRSTHPRKFQQLQKLTHLMDNAFQVPGTKIGVGLDSIIGLIPGIGDLATGGVSAYIIYEAWRMQVGKVVLTRMIFNVLVDVLVGTIPALGDVFDVVWKANAKNMVLLEKALERKAK